jgi:hypothetical protein
VQARTSAGNNCLGHLIVVAEPADKVCNALGVFPRLHDGASRRPNMRLPKGTREGTPMFIKIAILMSGLWLLTACTVTPARVEVSRPAVVVPAVTVESPPPVRHCPPGHAKKGWC